MIAAVVDPRGREAAESILVRMAPRWSERHARGGAVVARADLDAPLSEIARASDQVREALDLESACRIRDAGAFVALDAEGGEEGAVILGRGALGGRALYYTATGPAGGWAACSRLEPLLRARGTAGAPDADRLASLVVGLADPRPLATPYEGIARVGPCTAVVLGRHGDAARANEQGLPRIRERPPAPLEGLAAPAEELAAELWRRLEASVRRAMGAAKRVAVMVGGGVDSSGLLAAAVAQARGASACEVAALALDFEAISSDRPYLAALARDLGIVPVRLAPREAAPYYASSFVLDAQPYILSIGPMEQLVFRRARELGAEVLLSGYLADEILAGDLRGLAAEALAGSPVRAVKRAVRLRLPWPTTARERLESFVLRPILKPLVPRRLLASKGAGEHARDYPWAGPRLVRVLREMRAAAAEARAPRTPSERFDHFARTSGLADYADMRGQMEAATGLVRRDPYADEDVLALLAAVPPSVLSEGDMHRGLFRVALRGRVPESIRMRLDKAWFEPAFAEVAAAAGGLASLGDLWDLRALEALDIVDAARFKTAMAPLFRNPASTVDTAELWSAATQALACESFARSLAGGGAA